MNIIEDDDQSRRGMLAETDAEDNNNVDVVNQNPRGLLASDSSFQSHNRIAQTNNFVDETHVGAGPSPRLGYEESEWQR